MAQETKVVPSERKAGSLDFELIQSKSPVFYETYERKSGLKHQTHYCPGCGHGSCTS